MVSVLEGLHCNSFTVYRIPAKLGTKIHLNAVCQLSRQLDNPFVFYGSFYKCAKRRNNKNEETKPIFEVSYLIEVILFNLVCRLLTVEGMSTEKLAHFVRSENHIIFLSIHILMVLHAGFLGRKTHYCMS